MCPWVLFCRLRLYHGTPRALLHPLLQEPVERKAPGLAVLGTSRASYDSRAVPAFPSVLRNSTRLVS